MEGEQRGRGSKEMPESRWPWGAKVRADDDGEAAVRILFLEAPEMRRQSEGNVEGRGAESRFPGRERTPEKERNHH